jgi:DNA invertase Pin-like site-specific DNA recombinase
MTHGIKAAHGREVVRCGTATRLSQSLTHTQKNSTGAFAEFDRSMIRQRIKAGLKRAVAQGTRLGRPKVDVALERKAQRQLEKGVGILKVAKMLGLGTGTVQWIKQEMRAT